MRKNIAMLTPLMAQMTDSLALYNLLATLDPSLNDAALNAANDAHYEIERQVA